MTNVTSFLSAVIDKTVVDKIKHWAESYHNTQCNQLCFQVQNCVGIPMLLTAWSITEVIRYAFYTFSLLGSMPYFVQWCRWVLRTYALLCVVV